MPTVAQSKPSKTCKTRRSFTLHKPNGLLSPKVQAVGPERFGIVAVDCAKRRSKLILGDFYAKAIMAPFEFDHSQGGLTLAVLQVRQACEQHGLKETIVAIERTALARRFASADEMLTQLQHAIDQLPRTALAEEAVPLVTLLAKTRAATRRGPQLLGNILPLALARLGVGALQSTASGDDSPS